jgi:hypothetical protein
MSSMLVIWIYTNLIVVDNMIDVILFRRIDMSRSCVDMSSIFYNIFIMFMIYFYIKCKLKILLYPFFPFQLS